MCRVCRVGKQIALFAGQIVWPFSVVTKRNRYMSQMVRQFSGNCLTRRGNQTGPDCLQGRASDDLLFYAPLTRLRKGRRE